MQRQRRASTGSNFDPSPPKKQISILSYFGKKSSPRVSDSAVHAPPSAISSLEDETSVGKLDVLKEILPELEQPSQGEDVLERGDEVFSAFEEASNEVLKNGGEEYQEAVADVGRREEEEVDDASPSYLDSAPLLPTTKEISCEDASTVQNELQEGNKVHKRRKVNLFDSEDEEDGVLVKSKANDENRMQDPNLLNVVPSIALKMAEKTSFKEDDFPGFGGELKKKVDFDFDEEESKLFGEYTASTIISSTASSPPPAGCNSHLQAGDLSIIKAFEGGFQAYTHTHMEGKSSYNSSVQKSSGEVVKEDRGKKVEERFSDQKGVEAQMRHEDIKSKLLSSRAATVSSVWREYLENYFLYSESQSFPSWIDPKNIRDKAGRDPFNPDYDFTTLWIPSPHHKWFKDPANKAHLTPGMQQYWEVKQHHFDKVVFFKMGRFYEIFYIDACIARRICDLRWMGGGDQKPHVGFPEQSLHHFANVLVGAGYKVVVVEQMETPKELEERNRQTSGPKDRAIKREVCEVFSQGTLLHADMLTDDAHYLLAFCMGDQIAPSSPSFSQDTETQGYHFGICFVDVTTSKIYLGNLLDPPSRILFRTLIAQLTPSELLYGPNTTPFEIIALLKNLPTPPQLTPMSDFPNGVVSDDEFQRYCSDLAKEGSLPEALQLCLDHPCVMNSFAAICRYLRANLLDEKVMKFAQYEVYEPFNRRRLILDDAAITNLELLQTQEGTKENSLFAFLNHTSTAFGSRLFRRWVCAPLFNISHINSRLDGVEWLSENSGIVVALKQELKKLPDVERLLSRICSKGLQGERGAVYFENVHNKTFAAFCDLLQSFETIQTIMIETFNKLVERSSNGKAPSILAYLTTIKEDGGLFPDLKEFNERILSKISRDEDKGFYVLPGFNEAYDAAELRVNSLKKCLEDELQDLIEEWKIPSLKFVNSKFRYEIECPDFVAKRLQQSVDVTSTKKGFIRFQTDSIKELVADLEDAELAVNDANYPVTQSLFRIFYENFVHYQSALRLASEFDCLLSLASVVMHSSGAMCRPVFMEPQDDVKPTLKLEECRHPIAALMLSDFIPNDTHINTEEVDSSALLVTGPNMGGKSTVLRQTCIAVVMAQLGCFVPATSCVLTPVDRIFTRIGAKDSILEGKSTFYMELLETKAVLESGTRYSLAILDELGRGTSTFDGTAIAMATLEYIANTVQCRCMFSTHFHLLCEEFRSSPSICNFHMAAKVDEELGNVTFLYKFIRGACPKSHGIHVARLAGISEDVLECANAKSLELEAITTEFHDLAKLKALARQVIDSAKSSGSDSSIDALLLGQLGTQLKLIE